MKKKRFSIKVKFIIYVTLLIISLVSLILFIIEKREVNTIFEESKNKGFLIAKNIADLNLKPFLFWDKKGIKENIEKQIDNKLLYIIFYDKENKPFVATDSTKNFKGIYKSSYLKGNITPEHRYFNSLNLKKNGKTIRVLEVEIPIFAGDSKSKWGSVKIGLSLEEMYMEIRRTRLILLLLGGGGIIIGIISAIILAQRITNPIKKLVEGTIKISKGDFTYKINITSGDEIADLAEKFNEMTSKLLKSKKEIEEANKKLIQAEKLASIGRISTGIAHEIRNPLTSVKLNIQKVLNDANIKDDEREHLGIALEGINQIDKIVKDILDFARVTRLNLDEFSLPSIIEESIKLISNELKGKKITIEKSFESNLPTIIVDADKLRQVFTNLLMNSIEAIERKGKIKIIAGAKNRKFVKIIISDTGCGIPSEILPEIFEPFFTTKSSGTGLGLANAKKIIEQHKGSIQVFSERGKGTTFEIIIPRRPK
ncbi:ATP-binding protein [Candidatus Aminicenantes bacterium AC-335-A11]|jgi:signal transduction histidine kinase|nr:ATP-binding protein [SCandidatus Aminicenantes bacterium Aminicenantia_JdfR_composite]MCP2596965.1 ATP-binding protein [Candidatus Aminicenantes bacterium AC-335-G13]MCP2605943.1 ATP-binding protein [Candidatus Aminicenantes bacterium AC-708-I09]MCP2618282.1 ATP-binding protein [Candidatus Aminicenantes bacterium AC-335-A11]MCP2620387.1 ATP-binding protein [Candidatus Aminicenantes bacterium AC-334-E05]